MSDNNKFSLALAKKIQRETLNWYDCHARELPWRAKTGEDSNPYHVWLSEIMLQQTTVTAVIPYFNKFIAKWATVSDLAAASQDEVMHEWAGLGYYSRARNLHKAARMVVDDFSSCFPVRQKELLLLPGVGDYTSAAISTIAFDRPAVVIDGNIERIMSRLLAFSGELPKAKTEMKALISPVFMTCVDRVGGLSQAFMDIGSRICTPKNPKCDVCPLYGSCLAFKKNEMESYPRKAKKRDRPSKKGYVYCVFNAAGEILLERRPDKGLLAGTLGFPSSDWLVGELTHMPEFVDSVPMGVAVSHVFTHFDLELKLQKVYDENLDGCSNNRRSYYHLNDNVFDGLPSLFKKVYMQVRKQV